MSATSDLIQKIYIGYFGRAGDPEGLNYWVQRSSAGLSDAAIAQSFSVQDEATDMYGFLAAPSLNMGREEFLNSVYQNLFGRDMDAEGEAYWIGQLNNGRPVGGIILDIINGARNTSAGQDLTVITNKLAAANYYTEKVITSNATWTLADDQQDAIDVLSEVDATTASVTAAEDLADELVAADTAPAGQTFTLTAGRDSGAAYTGGVGADSFEGTDATLTVFDALAGGAGQDSLELTFAESVEAVPAGVSVSGIEDVSIAAADGVKVDISGWTGVETLEVTSFDATGKDVLITSSVSESVTVVADQAVEVTDATATEIIVATGKFAVAVTAESATDITVVTHGGDADINAVAIENLAISVGGGKVSVDTESTALNLTVAGDADVEEDSVDLAVAGLAVDVSSESKLGLDFGAATSLAISGSAEVELTAIGLAKVTAITISEDVGVTSDVSGLAKLTTITSTSTGDMPLTIDATATSVTLAGGDDSVTQAADLGKTQNISLGEGDDRFVAGGKFTGGAVVAGGDGDDILSVTSAVLGTNASAVISGFETLWVSDAQADALNVKNFDSIQDVVLVAGNSKAATISGLTTGATVTYVAANAGASTLTVTNAVAGAADVVNLVFDATKEGGVRDYDDVLAADVETLNIETIGDTKGGDAVKVGLSDDHTSLVVTGDVDLEIDTAMTAVTEVDASDFDAALTITLLGSTEDVTVTAGDGDNDITGGDGADTITVGDGDNVIDAGKGENIITAGDGDNKVTGGDDVDTITTGAGDDIIIGGKGGDIIIAGDGANNITGGLGGDTMTGGDDVDTYVYAAVAESGGANVDVITNFGEDDVIDLSAILLGVGAYVGEVNGFGNVLIALTGAVGETVFDTGSDLLYVDVDGNGAITVADMVIELTGVSSLEAANFAF